MLLAEQSAEVAVSCQPMPDLQYRFGEPEPVVAAGFVEAVLSQLGRRVLSYTGECH